MLAPMAAYDPATALVVVDVQNDFADPRGNLSVEHGQDIIPAVNEQIAAAARAGATIVYTQDWHPEQTPHFEKDGGVWPVHCVRDTWGAKLHPELDVVADAVRIRKGVGGEDGYSAFTVRDPQTGHEQPTDLHGQLQARGIERLVICGLAQDVCVLETVIDARDRGYDTTVLADAMAAVDLAHGDAARAVARMVAAGAEVV
jgi:nicotinamidase/pyrazinamidase